MAVAAYMLAALCVSWLVSSLFGPMEYAWSRFAIEAVVSTCLGMIVSWRLTKALFSKRSGKVVFLAFAGVVLLVFLSGRNTTVNMLHTGQAVLLLGLAYGFFWPHRRRAR
jgi:Kef-type K+ transport system membrane component KefB